MGLSGCMFAANTRLVLWLITKRLKTKNNKTAQAKNRFLSIPSTQKPICGDNLRLRVLTITMKIQASVLWMNDLL